MIKKQQNLTPGAIALRQLTLVKFCLQVRSNTEVFGLRLKIC